MARDKAFCFYYADALHLLEQCGGGAGGVFSDDGPKAAGGLFRPLSGRRLSGAVRKTAVGERSHADGRPDGGSERECPRWRSAAVFYLHDTLECEDGQFWPMAGVIPQKAWKTPRLSRFGYVTLTARTDGLLLRTRVGSPPMSSTIGRAERPERISGRIKPLSSRGWDCGYSARTPVRGIPAFPLLRQTETAARFVAACAACAAPH